VSARGGSPPGFLRAAGAVLAKDLTLEWRTLDALSAMGLFSLVVMVVFSFAFDPSLQRRIGSENLVPGVLWVTIAFAAIVGLTRSFHIEHHRDSITALALAPVDRGAVFAGKAAANLVQIAALEALLVPLSAVLFDYDLVSVWSEMLLIVALHTVALVVIGTLFAAVAARLGRGEALLATLLLPASTPVFLSAVRATGGVLAGDGLAPHRDWLLVTAGLDVLYFFVALATFEFVLDD
jgi:heme exporter protein B